MVRVLHEVANLDGGGVARLLHDYYLHMDHDKIHFDFLISDDIADGILEKPLTEMGCTIYKIPSLKKNMKLRLKKIDEIIKNGNYNIVHSHISARSCFILSKAKKYGVKKRYAHAHIAYQNISKLKQFVDRLFLAYSKTLATQLFACGEDAGKYMWGEKAVQSGKVKIMRNAIDTISFQFDEIVRDKYRKELKLENKKVLGIVGRLDYQKNHDFLLDIFVEIEKMEPDKYKLLIIGRGPYEQRLKEKAATLGISRNIDFMGIRSDVSKLLNAVDLFILPSFYEGLPVVLVEAQANGVLEVASDTITKEMEVTDLISFPSLRLTAREWAKTIIVESNRIVNRSKYASIVKEAGYDIRCESKKMQDFYLQ